MRLPNRPTRAQLVAIVLASLYALANASAVFADGGGLPPPK